MGFHRTARHYLDVNRSDEISLNSRINVEPRMVPPISKYKILTLWFSYVELLCLQVVSWKLVKPCRHGVSFQHCTSYLS
jgi:hypothetical protein